jgi:alpha-1,6-mannosyltransferase
MLRVLDCHNFFSPRGGGVRRYELEKLRWAQSRGDVGLVFVQPDERTFTEQLGPRVVVEHLRGIALPRGEGYRQIVSPAALRPLLARHRPDVVECGSPYFMPNAVLRAVADLDPRPAVVGFWHADFPRAHFGRLLGSIDPRLAGPGERLGWAWARGWYGRFDGILVASERVAANLRAHGLEHVHRVTLGVDVGTFSPARRDPVRVERLRAGDPRRAVILFAHRLSREKGLHVALEAHRRLGARMEHAPALAVVGTGPARALLERAVRDDANVHALGWVDDRKDLAAWMASCDLAVSLSAWETFGLATAEALACGLPVVCADEGAAPELVERSGAGLSVPHDDAEALARAIAWLLDEGRLAERGRMGRASVEPLTWEAAFEREWEAYEAIRSRRRGR